MNKKDLDIFKELYSSVYDGEQLNEGPYSADRVQRAQQAQQGRDNLASIGGNAGLSRAAAASGDSAGAKNYMQRSQQIGDKRKAEASADSARQQSQRTQNRADDVATYRKALGIQTPAAAAKPASTDYKSKFAGARDAAIEKAKQIKGSPVVGQKPPTAAPTAPAQRPATAPTAPAQRPTAAPIAPVRPAASAAPKPAASSANPMDTWARSNPGLARKVANSSTPQAGKSVISARVNADNDRGPSTPTPSSSSSTTSGSSSSSGETDRLKKALDIKKSDVTSSYQWPSAKTIRDIAGAYASIYEAKKKDYDTSRDKDGDGDNDFADNMIARMVASGMSREEAIKKVKNKSYNKKDGLDEATAMAKRGHDETAIRNKIAKSTGGGDAADRATALANKETFGRGNKAARQKYAATQRGDFRDTTSSNSGLHGYAHKSNDPAVKAKQAARGAQRSALTPREKKQLNREAYEAYEFVASYLLENNFASTVDDANVIINNMSENWFASIMEEKKPLPVAKMKRKESKLLDNEEGQLQALRTDFGSKERKARVKELERFDNINGVRTSVAKRGGKQQHPMPEVGRFKPKDED